MEANYISTLKEKSWESNPYNYFYLLFEVHKSPLSTRAICSACGGLAHGLGQYVDKKLQPMTQSQFSYFRDTFELKEKLNGLQLSVNALIATYDAVSMYTNIDSEQCLVVLSTYLRDPSTHQKNDYDPTTLIAALEIVLRSNIMKF